MQLPSRLAFLLPNCKGKKGISRRQKGGGLETLMCVFDELQEKEEDFQM